MQKDVDMGAAGSLTVAILCIAVALLLRSFYKRYNRLENGLENRLENGLENRLENQRENQSEIGNDENDSQN